MGFKNPFARKSAAQPGSDTDASKPKLTAKEKRQQKKDAYYKKKDQKQQQASKKPAPIQTDPSASAVNAPEQAPPSTTVSAASPASRAASPTSSLGGNSAASPTPNAADVASVGSGGDPNGGVDVDAATTPVADAHNTPALMNLSGSSEVVETYQPPRLEAEKRKAEAAAAAANGEETAGEESPEGGETPGSNPTCNYCGCFN